LEAELLVTALKNALILRQPDAGPYFHSDRGSEYSTQAVRKPLSVIGANLSMSGVGSVLLWVRATVAHDNYEPLVNGPCSPAHYRAIDDHGGFANLASTIERPFEHTKQKADVVLLADSDFGMLRPESLPKKGKGHVDICLQLDAETAFNNILMIKPCRLVQHLIWKNQRKKRTYITGVASVVAKIFIDL
jgi:hypothetical protein